MLTSVLSALPTAAAMAMSAYDNNEPETPSVWTLSL